MEEDKVIYYGRLYDLYLFNEEENLAPNKQQKGLNKKEWYLTKSCNGIILKEILLEDAVRDEKGKIKVYEYGMGER